MNLLYFVAGMITSLTALFLLLKRISTRDPGWLQGVLHNLTCVAFCMPGYDSSDKTEAEALMAGARISLDPDSPARVKYQTALVWKCLQCRRHTYFYTAPGDFYPDSKAICDDCHFGTEPTDRDGCVARGHAFADLPEDDVS